MCTKFQFITLITKKVMTHRVLSTRQKWKAYSKAVKWWTEHFHDYLLQYTLETRSIIPCMSTTTQWQILPCKKKSDYFVNIEQLIVAIKMDTVLIHMFINIHQKMLRNYYFHNSALLIIKSSRLRGDSYHVETLSSTSSAIKLVWAHIIPVTI